MSSDAQPAETLLTCTTCMHHVRVPQRFPLADASGCKVEGLRDPVDGGAVYRRCAVMRRRADLCGPTGALHSARTEVEARNAP